MKHALLLVILLPTVGCATVEHRVSGPGGYSYVERATAVGKANIEKATQNFGGELLVESPDGTHVEARLDSSQTAEGITSENDLLMQNLTGMMVNMMLELAKKSVVPAP